jgi:hypothetical protein
MQAQKQHKSREAGIGRSRFGSFYKHPRPLLRPQHESQLRVVIRLQAAATFPPHA